MDTIRNLMRRNVEVIHPEDSIREAANKMKAYTLGALPVCDGDQLKGMLTDRDIVIRSVAKADHLEDYKVRDVMSPKITCIHDTQDPEEAAELMRKEHIRRLPVVNDENRLVGILSLDDLVGEDAGIAAATLREVIRSQGSKFSLRSLMKPKVAKTSAAVLGTLAAAGTFLWWKQNHQDTRRNGTGFRKAG